MLIRAELILLGQEPSAVSRAAFLYLSQQRAAADLAALLLPCGLSAALVAQTGPWAVPAAAEADANLLPPPALPQQLWGTCQNNSFTCK